MIKAKATQAAQLLVLAFIAYAIVKAPVASGHVARQLLDGFVGMMHGLSQFFDSILGGAR